MPLADAFAVRNTLAVAAVFAAGCAASPLATPPPPVDTCRADVCIEPSNVKDKVDLLFVLDDSPPMGPALAEWRGSLPRLVATLEGYAPLSYHFGVISADLGAGPAPIPALGCRPGGDGGVLRTGGVALAGAARYIVDDLTSGARNVTGDVAAALDAMSDVGTSGCAFPSPLEAAYRALRDPTGGNVGFLRPDALLVVIFVDNGDDCSAPPSTDLFDGSAAGVAAYGPLDRFRCAQFGIECNGMPVPPTSSSGLTGCTSRAMANGGKLLDLARYVDFFTRPAAQGGIKVVPANAILVGVTGPPDPFGVTVTSPCSADASVSSCPQVDPSCVSPTDARASGDPAVRLAAVINAASGHEQLSVCATNDDAIGGTIAGLLLSRMTGSCLNQAVAARSDGTPDCVATDVTANPDGSTTSTAIASCAENRHVTPCWALVDHLAQYQAEGCMAPPNPEPLTCKLPYSCQPVRGADGTLELYSLLLDRGTTPEGNPVPPPANTTTAFSCATIPQP